MGEGIKSAYATSLLIYLMNGSILLCIIGYQILVVSQFFFEFFAIKLIEFFFFKQTVTLGIKKNLMPYFVFIMTVYLVITIFCILSEHLIAEVKLYLLMYDKG